MTPTKTEALAAWAQLVEALNNEGLRTEDLEAVVSAYIAGPTVPITPTTVDGICREAMVMLGDEYEAFDPQNAKAIRTGQPYALSHPTCAALTVITRLLS